MKLNGKPSTNTLNTLNTWLPSWLQPLVDGGEEGDTAATTNTTTQTTHNDDDTRLRTEDSANTTLRNPTPITTTTTVKSEHPPAPPRFNEPYFDIQKYKQPGTLSYAAFLLALYINLPISIFFDANAIYALSCLTELTNYIWALAVYAVAVAIFWFVVLVADLHSYRKYWSTGRPGVYEAYMNARIFNLTCCRSVHHFRFLHTIRAETRRQSTRDYWLEKSHHYMNSG